MVCLTVCKVNLGTVERAFRELGHHRDQSNEVLQVVEVESILVKVFNNAREDAPGGYNYSLVTTLRVYITGPGSYGNTHACVLW